MKPASCQRSRATGEGVDGHAVRRTFVGAKRNARRRGVALLIILGVLTLLALLAVTFTGMMRIERSAAGNFKKSVQGRELLHAALARALQKIDADQASSLYPTNDVVVSGGGIFGSPPNILEGEASNFVPRVLWSAAAGAVGKLGWVPAGDGAVSYMILNCSGLLDANTVGGGEARLYGTDATEIALEGMPEILDAGEFITNRIFDLRYETLDELTRLQEDTLRDAPSNLFIYSRCPPGFMIGSAVRTNLVDIGGDTNALIANSSNIIAALSECLVDGGDAAFVFTNLLDYVDTDSIPRDLSSPSTEAVPMLNEVQVYTEIWNSDPNTAELYTVVQFEWAFPFVASNSGAFTLKYEIGVENGAITNTKSYAYTTNFLPSGRTNSEQFTVSGTWGISDASKSFLTRKNIHWSSTNQVSVPVVIKYKIRAQILDSNSNVVDSVPGNWTNSPGSFVFVQAITNIPPHVPPAFFDIVSISGKECLDPRFNWDPTDDIAWMDYATIGALPGSTSPYEGSIGAINRYTTYWLDPINGIGFDGHTDMYVANRPLRQVGELTYLMRGRVVNEDAWHTLRLYRQGIFAPDTFMDHFTVGTHALVRGQVNPNTLQSEALAAALNRMPLDNYPGESNAPTLSWPDAVKLATNFISSRNAVITNMSDLGAVTNVYSSPVLSGLRPFQKEAFLRNASGLFNTRQNLFTILVAAQAVNMGKVWVDHRDGAPALGPPGTPSGGGWMTAVESDQRAVAVVWRDPFPDAEGHHPYLLLFFKPLVR